MKRILCLIRHDWKFTLNFVQQPRFDDANDCCAVGHYSGVCQRCGARDLFSGPAPTAAFTAGKHVSK